jgi:hypothetical protein
MKFLKRRGININAACLKRDRTKRLIQAEKVAHSVNEEMAAGDQPAAAAAATRQGCAVRFMHRGGKISA